MNKRGFARCQNRLEGMLALSAARVSVCQDLCLKDGKPSTAAKPTDGLRSAP